MIPGIDVPAGLRRTGGNRKRYEALLRKFAEQQDGVVAAIEARCPRATPPPPSAPRIP